MNILALDPATRCGWAHSCGASGTWDLSVLRDESKGMKFIRLQGKLNELKATVGIDLLVFEAARNSAPHMQGALVVQAEIQGVIKLWCEEHSVEYRGYSPSEIKTHATGKGNSAKPLVFQAAKLKWPHKNIQDDNEADALWLLSLVQGQVLCTSQS